MSIALLAAGCAAGESIERTTGDVAEQARDGIEAVPVAAGLACDAERRTLETAVEAYTLLTGAPPQSESDLVGDLVREESALFDLDPSGAVVPAPGSDCA